MRSAFYDNPAYKKKQAAITRKYWESGKYDFLRVDSRFKLRRCQNSKCLKSFQVKQVSDRNKFCSSRCAALVNNAKRRSLIIKARCLSCGEVPRREGYKYCNNKCQKDYAYKIYIEGWKNGLVGGNQGITTKTLSRHIKRYLKEKLKERCSLCGWNKTHPVTGHIPIEIDHIDGNSSNNKEENLRLVCPNCHSLTSNFRNLNKGKGRSWRLTYIAQHKVKVGK